MKRRRRAAIEALILAVVAGLIIALAIYLHASGQDARLFEHKEAGEQFLAVLYNLVLMLATGTVIGLLMLRLTEAMGYHVDEIDHFGDGERPLEGVDEA